MARLLLVDGKLQMVGDDGVPLPPEPEVPTTPAAPKAKPKRQLTCKVGRETKGRRGNGVTVVFEVNISSPELEELGTKLKHKMGTGGTVKDGRIEIQGDQRERITAELVKMGFQVKRAGG